MSYILGNAHEVSSPFGAHGKGAHKVRSNLGATSPFGAHGRGAHMVRSYFGGTMQLGYIGERSSPFGAHGKGHLVRSALGALTSTQAAVLATLPAFASAASADAGAGVSEAQVTQALSLIPGVSLPVKSGKKKPSAEERAKALALAKEAAELRAKQLAADNLAADMRNGLPPGTTYYRATHGGADPPGFQRPSDGGAPPSVPSEDSGIPGWVKAAAGVAAIVGIGVVVARRRSA